MIFRQFTNDEIAPWYERELCTTFAPQECKPIEDIYQLQREKRFELWGLFENNVMVGYATLWMVPGIPLVLVDYLGVTASRRNGGLGSEILGRLKAQGRPVAVEAEKVVDGDDPAENAMRERRIGFYIRNGFKPVYPMATCGFAFQTLLYDETDIPIADIMEYHRLIYGENRPDVRIPLPDGEKPILPHWMKEE